MSKFLLLPLFLIASANAFAQAPMLTMLNPIFGSNQMCNARMSKFLGTWEVSNVTPYQVYSGRKMIAVPNVAKPQLTVMETQGGNFRIDLVERPSEPGDDAKYWKQSKEPPSVTPVTFYFDRYCSLIGFAVEGETNPGRIPVSRESCQKMSRQPYVGGALEAFEQQSYVEMRNQPSNETYNAKYFEIFKNPKSVDLYSIQTDDVNAIMDYCGKNAKLAVFL